MSAVKTLLGISHLTSFLNSIFIGLGINSGRCDTCYSLHSSQMPLISSGHGSTKQKSLSFSSMHHFWVNHEGISSQISSLHLSDPAVCKGIPRLGVTSLSPASIPIPAAHLSLLLGKFPPLPARALINLYCSVCCGLTCN